MRCAALLLCLLACGGKDDVDETDTPTETETDTSWVTDTYRYHTGKYHTGGSGLPHSGLPTETDDTHTDDTDTELHTGETGGVGTDTDLLLTPDSGAPE